MKELLLRKQFIILLFLLCLVLLILAGFGFGVFSNQSAEVIEVNQNGGDLSLNYSSPFAGLQIKNVPRTTDAVGKENFGDGEYLDFSVDTLLDNATTIEYEISIQKDETNSTISDDDIRIYLEKEVDGTYTEVFGPEEFKPLKNKTKLGSEKGSMVLYKNKQTKSTSDHYRLRLWLSDKSIMEKGNYMVNVIVSGESK